MNCTKQITLTGYTVRYADLREPKPRTIHEELYTVDKDMVGALALLGLDVAGMITARYERGGYHVTSVERIQARRVACVDLVQLWEAAATDDKSANSQALTNLEENAHD